MPKEFCFECSPTHQLNHASSRWSSLIADKMERANNAVFPKRLQALSEQAIIGGIFHGMHKSGLLKETPINEHTHIHQRSRVVAEEAARRGMQMRVLNLFGNPTNFFVLRRDGAEPMIFEGLPGLDPIRSTLEVDDKEWSRALMTRSGFPTPQGQSFTRPEDGLVYGDLIGFPLVVKPRFGSLSAHTTVNIQTPEELARAIAVARVISFSYIVERYVPGSLYRATTVGDSLVAVGRRDPPYIVGDGISTVAELVERREVEQRALMVTLGYKPEEIPSLPRHHMKADPKDVLPKGERVAVTWKINLSYGATVEDVTDVVHPDNKAMFETIAKAVGKSVLGIDFLAPSIADSWKDQSCAVIELNSLPSIDLHHAPIVTGTPRDVAGALLDYTIKRS